MGVLLILFLSMYTWNKNTHVLDDFSTDVGLELTGGVITPIRYVQDKVTAVWKRYVYLVDVNEKNAQLEARVRDLEASLLAHNEDMADLARLRERHRLLGEKPGDAADLLDREARVTGHEVHHDVGQRAHGLLAHARERLHAQKTADDQRIDQIIQLLKQHAGQKRQSKAENQADRRSLRQILGH